MTLVALIRHGVTAWNAEGRIQGSRDIPLSPAGRAALARRAVPADLAGWNWIASPRTRCQETLAVLHPGTFTTDERLAEMAWGEWEGQRLDDLRAGGLTAGREALGLDFRPPGGESPRELQGRIAAAFADIAAAGHPSVVVTHKGVIRAVLSLATGWDMRSKPPAKLDWTCAHLFRLDSAGRPTIERLNLPLAARSEPDPLP